MALALFPVMYRRRENEILALGDEFQCLCRRGAIGFLFSFLAGGNHFAKFAGMRAIKSPANGFPE